MEPELRPGRLTVGLVGAGRVGAPIAAALARCGHRIVGASGVSEESVSRIETLLPGVPRLVPDAVVAASEVVLLAVPDDAIEDLASGLVGIGAFKAGQIVVHFSGRHGLAVLDAVASVGAIPMAIHPAMTFTGTSLDLDRMVDATFAVTAPGPFIPIAQAIVVELGGEPVVIAEENRALYHAAIVHAANHAVTLVAQAAALLAAAGVEEPGRLLAPVVHASIDGALAEAPGAANSLTGPVVRGDAGTIAAHVGALSSRPQALASYAAMARATADLALASGRLGPADYAAVIAAIGPHGLVRGNP